MVSKRLSSGSAFPKCGERSGLGKGAREGRPNDIRHGIWEECCSRRFRTQSKTRMRKLVGPFQVLAFVGIDADDFAFVDEGRNLHHHSGLKLGGLCHIGG